ncbi:MAG: hypothetical protein ABEJ69_00855 [Candidatus Nanohaloarchaea archaeon]
MKKGELTTTQLVMIAVSAAVLLVLLVMAKGSIESIYQGALEAAVK